MEIIVALLLIGVVGYFVFFRKKEEAVAEVAPYKVETPVQEPEVVKVVEEAPVVTVEVAEPVVAPVVEEAPAKKPRKPRTPKAEAKAPAKKAAPKKAAAIKAKPKATKSKKS